jgi:crotonobetainyl-CoA:carnitine CoA-transferase CaiB-like acyl-CoA transferase
VLVLRDEAGGIPYSTLAARVANRDVVNGLVGRAVAQRKRQDVLDALDAEGIPCAPVNTIAEHVSDPTLVPSRVLDRVRVVEEREAELAGPLFAADFLPDARFAPPRLGERTQEVLQSLGYSDANIQLLRENGAIG